MMKEVNEESAEQTRRSVENDSKKCARFKLNIAVMSLHRANHMSVF